MSFTVRMKKFNRIFGFTLLELVFVLAIVGIVASIAAPSFQGMILGDNLISTSSELKLSLKRARGEAIARGVDVTICSSLNGTSCSGAAGNWAKGWIVFEDANGDGAVASSELIWVHNKEALSSITVTASASFEKEVVYSARGILAGGVAGYFRICSGLGSANGLNRRDIDVDVSGAPVFRLMEAVIC